MEFKRTYTNLKLIRGKRKDTELNELSESDNDLGYRRLLIEEREKDIHVFYSWHVLLFLSAVPFMLLSAYTVSLGPQCFFYIAIAFIFLLLSLIFKIIREHTIKNYILTVKIVDSLIEDEYGISMPSYL